MSDARIIQPPLIERTAQAIAARHAQHQHRASPVRRIAGRSNLAAPQAVLEAIMVAQEEELVATPA